MWYWEKAEFTYESDAYDKVKSERGSRLDAMVGYYGGSDVDRPSIGQTPIPEAQLINAEELALTIIVPGKDFTGTLPTINVTITVSSGGVKHDIVTDASLNLTTGTETYYTGRIALDTLDASKYTNDLTNFAPGDMGKHFKDWGSGIAPGSDIEIEIKVMAVDTGSDPVSYLSQYIHCGPVNSLFEKI